MKKNQKGRGKLGNLLETEIGDQVRSEESYSICASRLTKQRVEKERGGEDDFTDQIEGRGQGTILGKRPKHLKRERGTNFGVKNTVPAEE